MTALVPVVSMKDGKAVTNSLDVAEFFARNHRDLAKKIDALSKNAQCPQGMYVEVPFYNEGNGQTYRSYDMTRDGFTLLVMGFTGEKAMRFKLAYIKRFNEMEEALANDNKIALPDFSDPAAAARAWADQFEQTKQLQIENTKQKQILEFITVDTYRTLYKKGYWDRSAISSLSKKASKLAAQKGITLGHEIRTVTLPSGVEHRNPVNVYPKSLLDEAYWLLWGKFGPSPKKVG